MSRHVLVTGGAGFIGSHVTRRLLGRGDRVTCLDDFNDFYDPSLKRANAARFADHGGWRLVEGDIRDTALVDHLFADSKFDSVIHLAAYYDFFGEPSPKYDEVTVRGTERLLRGLGELGFRVEQIAFSSTMLVHKPAQPGQFINEDWPLEPTWAYPESKVRTEELIHRERGDIPAVLLRISGVYDDLCHSIPLAHQIQRIYEKQLTGHIYPADTSRGQAFVHLDDLVDAFERVIARRADLPPEAALLIGEPEAVS